MINEGTNVRVIKGGNKDRVGVVKGHMPMSAAQDVSNGKELSMEGATELNLIEFEGGQQDLLEDESLEIIT